MVSGTSWKVSGGFSWFHMVLSGFRLSTGLGSFRWFSGSIPILQLHSMVCLLINLSIEMYVKFSGRNQ